MFARSAGSQAGPLLSKSLEVKELVVRLCVARGPTWDQKVEASMIYNYIQNRAVRTTHRVVSNWYLV